MLRAPKSRVARASPRDIGANWSGRRMSKAASVSANALATATSELQGHRNQLQTLYAKPFSRCIDGGVCASRCQFRNNLMCFAAICARWKLIAVARRMISMTTGASEKYVRS